jgi:hypothetical protein
MASVGENKNAYIVQVGKSKGGRTFGRSGCRWCDNIKMDLKEIGLDGAECGLG